MADVKVTVEAGVCQFRTIVNIEMDEEMNFVYKLVSACPQVRELGKNMPPVPMFDAIAMPFTTNYIYKEFGDKVEHVACPVPCALVKASEVACDMALKKDVSFKIE